MGLDYYKEQAFSKIATPLPELPPLGGRLANQKTQSCFTLFVSR